MSYPQTKEQQVVSKASLETLARTMSIGLLTLAIVSISALTVSQAAQAQVTETHTTPVALTKGDTQVPTRTEIFSAQSSRSRSTLRASKLPAPKDVKARGKWVKRILKEAGFEGKALRTAWAVVMKESTGRPTAYNGNTSTGDKSYGIFQINMIGELGVDRREKFKLDSNKELFNPLKNAKIAYYMTNGGENWSAWDIDSTGYSGGTDRDKYLEWLAQYPKG